MLSINSNGCFIHFNKNSYSILNKHIKENKYSNIFIIVDENSNNYCLQKLLPLIATDVTIEIIEIESGEENKTIEICVHVWHALIELKADRKSLIINLGGGVITDLGGFIASTFKRGISFINIPTTLLAMVDASIGGKNGIDLGGLKNQIGTINLPQMVIIDTEYLDTLPQNQLKSGYAEMLKHGLIAKKSHWEELKNSTIDKSDNLESHIYESVHIKNKIVCEDPFEIGVRKALNFGHTLGHAIETYCLENKNRKDLLHGEAIVIGIILESYISFTKELISKLEYLEIKTSLLKIYEKVNFEENEITEVIELLSHDKKNEYGEVLFCLLDGMGSVKINQIVSNKYIKLAFEDYKK